MIDRWIEKFFTLKLKIRYNFLPSSSIILIIVPKPSITSLVIDELWKERLYCSIVSRPTVSLMIVKLDSPWDCAPCAAKLIASFILTPDISTVKGWVPGP